MPTFRSKQNLRECGCKLKGPHKESCDESNRGRKMKITNTESKRTAGRFNISNLKRRTKRQEIEIDDSVLEELMLHQVESEENLWSLLEDAPHNTVQAFVFSETSKNGDVSYFNKLNSPNLGEGHIFYSTRNGGVGVNSGVFEDGFQDGDMVGLIMVDLGNFYDLVDDDES